jgi:hypothetical protein
VTIGVEGGILLAIVLSLLRDVAPQLSRAHDGANMALWDYYPQVRSGRRVTIKGDRPF